MSVFQRSQKSQPNLSACMTIVPSLLDLCSSKGFFPQFILHDIGSNVSSCTMGGFNQLSGIRCLSVEAGWACIDYNIFVQEHLVVIGGRSFSLACFNFGF